MHLEGKWETTETIKAELARQTHYFEFNEQEVVGAVRLEWYGSDFSEPGPDYNVWKLLDAEGNVIASRRMEGY